METQNLVKKLLLLFVSTGLAACGGKVLDKDDSTVDKAEVIELRRDWQRVIRYNCAGVQTSDQIETVKSPVERMIIKPNTKENIWSSSFRNLTNNWNSVAITNYTDFNIDMAPTLLNLKVEKGINELRYEFYYCDNVKINYDSQGNYLSKDCLSGADLREQGSIFLNISYVETTLPGFSEVRETCPTPTPTPTPAP